MHEDPVSHPIVDPTYVLGVDIGGSGMKAAIVDPVAGQMITDRFRIPTPQPATPEAMASVFADLVAHFAWTGPIGCTFPGVVRQKAVIETAANLESAANANNGEYIANAYNNPSDLTRNCSRCAFMFVG